MKSQVKMRDVEKITAGNGKTRCIFRVRAHKLHACRRCLGLRRAPGDGGDALGGCGMAALFWGFLPCSLCKDKISCSLDVWLYSKQGEVQWKGSLYDTRTGFWVCILKSLHFGVTTPCIWPQLPTGYEFACRLTAVPYVAKCSLLSELL